MMHHITDRNRVTTYFLFLLPLLVAMSLARPASSQDLNIKVDCGDKGQSVTQALKFARGQPITITVTGTCNENVVVNQPHVTLLTTDGAVINGPDATQAAILVIADGVTINGLAITGGISGVIAANGSQRLNIVNCDVHDTAIRGIVIGNGSEAVVNHCTVHNNTQGIGAYLHSSLSVINSVISNNTDAGIQLVHGSTGYIGSLFNETLGGNTIENNGASGIHVAGGSFAGIVNNIITHNGTNPNPNPSSSVGDCCAAFGQNGIGVFEAGVNIAGGNVISDNGAFGIEMRNSNALIGQGDAFPHGGPINVITGNGASPNAPANGGAGLLLIGSSVVLRGATITNNTGPGVSVGLGSNLQVVGGLLGTNLAVSGNSNDGIRVFLGGRLLLEDPHLSVSGNSGFDLDCFGTTAAVAGNVAGVPRINPNCTGF